MSDEQGDDAAVIARWTGYGADLAGALSGAAIGAASADAPGAVLGSVLGSGLASALGEASFQLMSRREKRRVGAVAVLAREKLLDRIGAGLTLRGDEFARPQLDGRSPADEVIEHVLQVAQRSYEERKLPHLAAVLASVAVSDWLDERTAHWLLTAVEHLTWPKLVAIALVADADEVPLPDAKIGKVDDWSPWSVHNVFLELQHNDQILRRDTRAAEHGMPDFSSYFADMELTRGGKLIHWAADVASISDAAREEMRSAIVASVDAVHGPDPAA